MIRNLFTFIFVIIIAYPTQLHSREVLHVFDTQSAMGADKGAYHIHLTAYRNGGLVLRAGVSINTYIHLGIMEFVDGLLGSGKNNWHIPGIYGKISVLNQPEDGWNLAFGWDAMNNGSIVWYENEPVYGPHIVATKGFFWGAESPHLFNFGTKMSITHKKKFVFAFASVYFRIFRFWDYGIEIDNVTFQSNAKYHFINNHVMSFNITDAFSVQFIFQLGINVHTIKKTPFRKYNGRNITLTYQNYF